MKKIFMVGGFDGANSFFSLFYAFEYWWSSDTVGNDLIGGEEKQKPARTPALFGPKKSLGLERFSLRRHK